MKIRYHKNFLKQYLRLPIKLQLSVEKTLAMFQMNPFHPKLNNHRISGQLKEQRSIPVTGDIRIIFEESDDYAFMSFVSQYTMFLTKVLTLYILYLYKVNNINTKI